MPAGVYDQKAITLLRSVFEDIRYQNHHAETVADNLAPMTSARLVWAMLKAADSGQSCPLQLAAMAFDLLFDNYDAVVIPMSAACLPAVKRSDRVSANGLEKVDAAMKSPGGAIRPWASPATRISIENSAFVSLAVLRVVSGKAN